MPLISQMLRVKKGNYNKEYFTLFGDSKKMQALKKPKFEDLDDHILLYQKCNDLAL